jgi:hypothetical protein
MITLDHGSAQLVASLVLLYITPLSLSHGNAANPQAFR